MNSTRTRYRLVSRRRSARLQVEGLEDRATPNSAPTLFANAIQTAIPEDPSSNAGDGLTALLGGMYEDDDGDPLAGAAVTGNVATAAQGDWQYSSNDGGSWDAVPTSGLSDTSALLIAAGGGKLRFVPATDFHGKPGALTLRAWDGNGGMSPGVGVNISAEVGGSGGFSDPAREDGITVTPVGDTPSVTDASTTVGTLTTAGLVITPNPADNNSVIKFRITGIANGYLYLNNGSTQIFDRDFITTAQGAAGLKFLPAQDKASPSTTFGFDVQATATGTENGLGGNVVHATVTVTDNLQPDTQIDDQPQPYEKLTTANFKVSGVDNIGPAVLRFEYNLNQGAWLPAQTVTPTTGAVTLTGLADGEHTLQVRAVDEAGNADDSPAEYTWTVDTIKPAIQISPPSRDDANNTHTVAYTVTYIDANLDFLDLSNGFVELIKTGTADASYSFVQSGPNVVEVRLSNLTGDGSVNFTLKKDSAQDRAGNKADAAGPSIPVNVDNTKPVLTIGAPSVATTKAGAVSWVVTVSDSNLDTPVTLTPAEVTLVGTPAPIIGDVAVTPIDATHFRVTVSNIRGGAGTLAVRVAANVASDRAGNLSAAPADSATVNVTGVRRLRLAIAAPPLVYRPGAAYTYTITYRNAGTQWADGAWLVVSLPMGATFNPVKSTAGWTPIGNGRYRLDLGTLKLGQQGTAKFAIYFANSGVSAEVFGASISDALGAGRPLATRSVMSRFARGRYA
jgi:hypothetical protein